jgi:uncharacterized membrane protein
LLSAAWPGDLGRYQDIANWTFDGRIPYRNFYSEYPPGAVVVFLVPRLFTATHYYLAMKLVQIASWVVVIWAVARLLEKLSASRQHRLIALSTLVLVPPLLGWTFLNRYDPYAAIFTVLALVALLEGHTGWGGAALGTGFATKIFPAAALPVVALNLLRTKGERTVVRAAAAFTAATAVFVLPFFVLAPGGVGFSYWSQIRRGLQIESMGASILLVAGKLGLYHPKWAPSPPGQIDLVGSLPHLVANVSFVAEIAAILAVTWLYWRGSDTNERLVAGVVACILGYTIFSKVLSPQYVTWLVPLVVLTRSRAAILLMVASLPLTQGEVYWGDHGLRNVNWSVWMLAARNVLLVAVFVLVVRTLLDRPAKA